MQCKDCKYSYKRDSFSFKKYGSHFAGYECCFDKNREKYVRLDDTCENFEKKGIKDNE